VQKALTNTLFISSNESTKFYRTGLNSVGKRSVLIGMSPGNGYFTEQNMVDILRGISQRSPKIYLVVPDEPHIHNYMGIGYSFEKAKKKAKKDNNQTNNRLFRAIEVLKNDLSMTNLSVINWSEDVEINETYLHNYNLILEEYTVNSDFKHCVNTLTYQYLESRLASRSVLNISVTEGVKYYLKELALFTAMPSILGDEPLVAYYKKWGNGLEYIEQLFKNFSDNFGMIQYELQPVHTQILVNA